MLEGNALMRKVEGLYAVLPFDEDLPAQQDLLAVATSVVGQAMPSTRSRSSSGSCSPSSLDSSRQLGKSQGNYSFKVGTSHWAASGWVWLMVSRYVGGFKLVHRSFYHDRVYSAGKLVV